MANRPVFYVKDDMIRCSDIEFQWFPGFAISQKRKSINALHEVIRMKFPGERPLEISTKGEIPLGTKLSAFNLKLGGHYLECVFQSSKVFDDTCKPHPEWLELSPKEAKSEAAKLHAEGRKLIAFNYNGIDYPLEPKTAFYDHIYYMAVKGSLNNDELSELSQFNCFTDIEFSPKKSLNTQARSAALVKFIWEKYSDLPDLSAEGFIELHKKYIPRIF